MIQRRLFFCLLCSLLLIAACRNTPAPSPAAPSSTAPAVSSPPAGSTTTPASITAGSSQSISIAERPGALFNLHDVLILSQADASTVFTAPDVAANGLNEAGDAFGAALVAADFDGDGIDDLVVGAPGEEALDAASGSGAAFFFQGSGGGPVVERIKRVAPDGEQGATEAAAFGAALAAGDFNGDGLADLAVAAPGRDSGRGAAHAFLGNRWQLRLFGSCTPADAAPGDRFGSALAAGDFNGDGFADLVASAAAGHVSICAGGAEGLQPPRLLESGDAGAGFGAALAVGDFNQDGFDDLAAGAPREEAGAVHVFAGGPGGLSGSNPLTLASGAAAVGLGSALATGDFDGDGFDDLAAATGTIRQPGPVVVFRGARDGLATQPVLSLIGAPGIALATGDANGDGYADLAVGSPVSEDSRVAVFAGGVSGLQTGVWVRPEDAGGRTQPADGFGAALVFGRFAGLPAASLAIAAPAAAVGDDPPAGTVTVLAGLPSQALLTHGPLLGGVSDREVKVWARADHAAGLAVSYRQEGDATWHTTSAVALTAATDFTGVLTLTGLQPATRYAYRLLLDSLPIGGSESEFTTLATPGAKSRTRFVLGSDLYYADPGWSVYDRMAARNPDFLLMLGDQIAVDVPVPIGTTRAAYDRKHRVYWAEPHWADFMRRIPSFMVWDDHEIWNDWSDGKSGRYLVARPSYEAYQGSHNPSPLTAGETYYTFAAGPIDFFILDTRTFRSPGNTPDGPGKTMLGEEQKVALKAWLLASEAPFKVIGSSVTFSDFGTASDTLLTTTDSWHAYAAERADLLAFVRDNCIPGVLFLTGDQHWAGVFRMDSAPPYHFYEFLVTPLALGTRKRPPIDDPQSLFQYDQSSVYGLFEADGAAAPPRLSFDLFSFEDAPLYHLDLTPADTLDAATCP